MAFLAKDSTVYIACVRNVRTGGTELLHQFASHLLKRDVDVRMVYFPVTHERDDVFAEYRIPYDNSIAAGAQNVLIAPEVLTETIAEAADTEIRRILWWLSVDNWLGNILLTYDAFYKSPQKLLKMPFPRKFSFAFDDTLIHWTQSEYARQFLLVNGIKEENIRAVSDYLNPVFLQRTRAISLKAKEPYVAFNPRKGMKFTQKLMAAAPDISWRPIKDMTPVEVEEFLQRAMVYVDFGSHPGKDRLPREAAACGCCVVTGQRGAAANNVDIPIAEEFKFADEETSVPQIISKIRYIFQNFPAEYEKFADYRKIIGNEPKKFAEDVDGALGLSPAPYTRVALLQQTDVKRQKCLAALANFPQFRPVCAVSSSLIPGGVRTWLMWQRRAFCTARGA